MRPLASAITLTSLLLAPTVDAATLALRATDQSDLSRVSVGLGERDFWFEQVGERQYDLVVAEPGHDFDTRQIFPDRLASRIISARQVRSEQESRLRFVLNCDCLGEARRTKGVAILEFRGKQVPGHVDDKPDAQPQSEKPRDFAAEQSAQAPKSSPHPVSRPGSNPVVAGGRMTVRPSRPAVSTTERPAAEPDAEIAHARERLLEQLTRAAEQGLLTFDARDAASSPPLEAEPKQTTAPATVRAAPLVPIARPVPMAIDAPTPIELPVRAHTAIDRDFTDDRSETFVSTGTCDTDRPLSEIQWPNIDDPASEIAKLRSDLLGEFDHPRTNLVKKLAVLYISLGLGVEARQVLSTYDSPQEDSGLLMDLARIVDGAPPDPTGALATAGPCSGRTAFWLAAARLRGLPETQMPSTNAEILDTFALLPTGLRQILGPELLSHYIDERNLDMARKVDQLLQRTPGEKAPSYDLALARLIALNRNSEASEAIYSRIANSRRADAHEALLLLVASLLDRDAVVPDEMTQRIEMASFIERRGPLGRDLKLAEIQARAGGGDLPAVLTELKRLIATRPHQAVELRDTAHALLESSGATDVGPLDYTRSVVGFADQISTRSSGDRARARVAQELTAIGLANEALKIITPALGRGDRDVRIAAAHAFLALDDPTRALGQLAQLSTPGADSLRVAAHRQNGEPARALDLLAREDGDHAALASDLAWLAGDWSQAVEAGPEPRRLLAAYMAGENAAPQAATNGRAQAFLSSSETTDEITIHDSKDVLERSKTVRRVIEEALSNG